MACNKILTSFPKFLLSSLFKQVFVNESGFNILSEEINNYSIDSKIFIKVGRLVNLKLAFTD